jgi:hypothetical protein
MPTTYKLFVPRKVEEKIRYLIRKFPSTEWSGVLFYTHAGKFEDGSLEIYCEDIYPMDLGTGTFTDFKMDETVVGYIAENIELFGCETGLCHSHHSLGAFLSGTDLNTIRTEGNDTNCFVSLVVDTKGTYVAALTRKVQRKTEVVTKSLGSSYEFFGEGEIKTDEDPMSESTQIIDKEVIEYFMLDVEIEHVDNPLAYLDTRFDEIEAKKKTNTSVNILPWSKDKPKLTTTPAPKYLSEDYTFDEYLYKKEPTLFTEEEMGEVKNVDWEPDENIIHKLVCQMVTCSLIVDADKLDLMQWIVRHMVNKYDKIFDGTDGQFAEWKEFIVEFQINQYDRFDMPDEMFDDYDAFQSKIASAMYDKLSTYPTNLYLEQYKKVLTRYIYE